MTEIDALLDEEDEIFPVAPAPPAPQSQKAEVALATPVPPVKFSPEQLPYNIIQLAQGCYDPDELEAVLELEADENEEPYQFSRQQLRAILAFAAREKDLDKTATAPGDPGTLSSKIDVALNDEIDRLVTENKVLNNIAAQTEGQKFKLKSTGEVIDAIEARKRLAYNMEQLLIIKKALTEEKKAKAAGEPANAMNLNIDLGTVVSSVLGNIKQSEDKHSKIIDVS